MDPLTHGITGALLGKAFFDAPPPENATARHRSTVTVAIIGTFAAMFPDVDVFFDKFVPNQMATLELHRGWTHSLVLLPVWSLGLALLTWPVVRRFSRASAALSFAALVLLYAVGIFSHIVLDLATSFGTMIWSPVSNARVAWDLVFIIDAALTSIVLLPQMLAWIYARREGSVRRAIRTLALLAALLFAVFWLARNAGVPFAPPAVSISVALLAVILFAPQAAGAGFGITRATWCRAGVAVLLIYYGVCAAAHARALRQVDAFIGSARLDVEHRAALPMPPWLLQWSGQIRTPSGVFISNFGLRDAEPPKFHVMPDSPANPFVETARQLPEIQTYLWFARFPVVRYFDENDLHIVEFSDTRFLRDPDDPRPGAFQYRVVMDDTQKVLWHGWTN